MSLFSGSSLFSEEDEETSTTAFSRGGKSKLGQLFGGDSANKAAGNDSLQYTRPKQPKKEAASPAQPGSKKSAAAPAPAPGPTYPAILVAVGAQLYKFDQETQKWSTGGKVGCAVVENKTGATRYQIILYYTKTQIICAAPITTNFVYTPQFSNNEYFGNFYDGNKQNWSIKFESQDDSDNVGAYVALAKFIEKGASTNELIVQDLLIPPKGAGVSDGDTVGMRYVCWTDKAGVLTKVDDNLEKNAPLRLVLGTKKGPAGLDAGIDGMKKGGRRVVVVPPAYEGADSAEAKIYKLTLEKLKRLNASADEGAAAAQTSPSPVSPSHPAPSRSRANSESNDGNTSDSGLELPSVDGGQDKAALLKRIAKMGVATIGHTEVVQEWDNSSHTTPTSTPAPAPVPTAAQPASPAAAAPMQQQQQAPVMQPPQQQQPYMGQQQPPLPYGAFPQHSMAGMGAAYPGMTGSGMMMPQYPPYGQYGHAAQQPGNQLALIAPGANPFSPPFFVAQAQPEPAKPAEKTEAAPATSSTETIKIMVEERQLKADINTKLDKVEKKVDDVYGMMQDSIFMGKGKDIAPGVSAKQLMVTIQRIVLENEKYAAEMDAKQARIETLTEKITKLHDANQRIVEENNRFLEERSTNFKSSTESTLKQLEQFREEKLELEQELTKSQKQFQTLKRAYTNLAAEMEEFKSTFERNKKEADAAVSRASVLDARVLDLEERLRESESMTKRVHAALDQAHVDLEAEKEQVARLTQLMEEHKAKFNAELAKREAQWEDERTTTTAELEQLREALRKERANMGATSQQIEQELQAQFQAQIKHQLITQENQLTQQTDLKLEEQRLRLENEWRARAKQLHEEHAAAMDSAQTENAQLRAHMTSLQARNTELQAQLHNANIFATAASAPAGSDSDEVARLKQQLRAAKIQSIRDFETSVKQIMNNVFQSLNAEFADEEDQQYNKAAIMTTIRQTIVQTTLGLVKQTQEQLAIQEEQEREASSLAEVRAAEAEKERLAREQQEEEERQRKAAEEAAQAEAAERVRAEAAAAREEAAQAKAQLEALRLLREKEAEEERARLAAAATMAAASKLVASSASDDAVEGEELTIESGSNIEAHKPDVHMVLDAPVETEETIISKPGSPVPQEFEPEPEVAPVKNVPNPLEDSSSSSSDPLSAAAISDPLGLNDDDITEVKNREHLLDDEEQEQQVQPEPAAEPEPKPEPEPEPQPEPEIAPAAPVSEEPKTEPEPASEPELVLPELTLDTSIPSLGGSDVHPLSKGGIFDSDSAPASAVFDPLASLSDDSAAPKPASPAKTTTPVSTPASSSAIFDDPLGIPTEPVVQTSTPTTKKKNPIFDDDDDDDFMASITKKTSGTSSPAPPKPASSTASPAPAKKSLFEIFGDDDDEMGASKPTTPQPAKKSLDELFGDPSAPASSSKPSTPGAKKKNPLFDDDEEF